MDGDLEDDGPDDLDRCPECGCRIDRPSRWECTDAPHPRPDSPMRAVFAVRRELEDRRLGWADLGDELQDQIDDALAAAIRDVMTGCD
jgi:hypothetical protein